jgi:hypothetical protein
MSPKLARYQLLIVILAATLGSSAIASEPPPDVRRLMTPEDFSASGLDRLTEAERAHLSEWVARYSKGMLGGPPPPKTPEELAEERAVVIEAKVLEFAGWTGKTVFRLDNGQMWKQRTSGRFSYSGNDSAVVISQNSMGYYQMRHVATGRLVSVKRIR